MPDVIIDSNLNYAEVKPVYKDALGSGANGIGIDIPNRTADSVFHFITEEARNGDGAEIPNTIEVYNSEDGDIAVFDPVGRDKQVYRRTQGGSYEEKLIEIINSSNHMRIA